MLRALIVATVLSASFARASAQVVFRAETDLVSFGVTVTDKRGTFLTDLTAEDFEILEDGKPQTLKYFIRGNETDAAPDLHVGIMFDTSGSMTADISTARTAAIKFLNALPEAKDITLVDFDTEVRLAKYGQQDFPRIVERIGAGSPMGTQRCTTRWVNMSPAQMMWTAGRSWLYSRMEATRGVCSGLRTYSRCCAGRM